MSERFHLLTAVAVAAIVMAGVTGPAITETSSGAKGATTLTVPAPGDIDYGDDSSDWAYDGECDDPRFTGDGMAVDLGTTDVGKDATDCRDLVEAGRIYERNPLLEMSSTNCSTIDFGNDTGDYANNGVCDDPRFAGYGVDAMLLSEDRGGDATDCANLCRFGWVWLRAE
ncbi:MAG: hypothetical protein AAFX39_07445 [Pseudomonadota bacterium]